MNIISPEVIVAASVAIGAGALVVVALVRYKPKSVSSIVASLQKTVSDLESHAADKFAAVDQHALHIAAHTDLKAEAEAEAAKAAAVAVNIGTLIGAHL